MTYYILWCITDKGIRPIAETTPARCVERANRELGKWKQKKIQSREEWLQEMTNEST